MWRARNAKQAKDKADIYNSREWHELRVLKLQANPLCEMCKADGYVTAATCVHHRVPIETATTKEEMRRLALDCGLSGLLSLCYACHAKVHKEMGSNTRKIVKQRAKARQERWADGLTNRFTGQ